MFLTQLLTLFQICRACKSDKALTEVHAHGTMAEVVTICVNPECGKRTSWYSQPNFPGTKIAAGNLLLGFAILVAGTSATKVFRVFQHMGLTCVSLTTFFKYQRVSKINTTCKFYTNLLTHGHFLYNKLIFFLHDVRVTGCITVYMICTSHFS